MSKSASERFSHLLLIGFTAKHWPLWPLLQAAVSFANRATVILEYPREQTRAADESWIGTWEENFEAATPIAAGTERSRPFAELIRSTDAAFDSRIEKPIHFLVGLNATEQARAVSAVAL